MEIHLNEDGGNTWLQGLMAEIPDDFLVLILDDLLQPLMDRLLSQLSRRYIAQSVEEVDNCHHGHEQEPKPESRKMN